MKKVQAAARSLKNRWLAFAAIVVTLTTLSVTNASAASAATGTMPTKACIPSNGSLSKYLAKPLGNIAGAVGGVLPAIVTLMVVLIALILLATALSKKGKEFMVKLVLVVALLPGVALVLMIGYAFWAMLKNACPAGSF